MTSNFYFGTSGLALPVPNKSAYPDEYKNSSRLQYYGSLFNSIEINSSFKKLPQVRTIIRWTTEVPDNFLFTFKVSETITHVPGLAYAPKTVENFLSVIQSANDKQGCLLFQFPGKLRADHHKQLMKLLTLVNKHTELKVACEFRHVSWYESKLIDSIKELGATIVLHDLYTFKQPFIETDEMNFIYLRFHGPEKGYRGSYTEEHLKEYARQIKTWIDNGKTVYAYFNNTLGDAAQNALTLNLLLKHFGRGQ